MKVMGQLMAIFEIISLGCDDCVILELFMYSEFWHQFRIESTIWTTAVTGESGGINFLEISCELGLANLRRIFAH